MTYTKWCAPLVPLSPRTVCSLTQRLTLTLDRVHAVQLAGAYSPSAREAEN